MHSRNLHRQRWHRALELVDKINRNATPDKDVLRCFETLLSIGERGNRTAERVFRKSRSTQKNGPWPNI